MHPARNFAIFAVVSLAACLFLSACAHQNAAPPPATQQATARPPAAAPDAWMHALESHQKELARLCALLPGRDQLEQERLMASVFVELQHLLPPLHGPYQDGVFEQEMGIIDHACIELTTSPPSPAVAPTIDAALRACANALTQIQQTNFADRPEIAEHLAQMQQSLDQLDAQKGALHRVVEANAVGDINQTLQAMNVALAAKI